MSIYASYTDEQREALLANYLVNSWSYSKVSTFARNEKEFERQAIYCERSKRSATSVAGNAYHKALELYFRNMQRGADTPLATLTSEAYNYIDGIPANDWRTQKTTPTIEECRVTASNTATTLLKNFLSEIDTYIEDFAEVLGVELRCEEWLTINGVDIPLPCHAVIDLAARLKDGRIAIIDHKSRASYTDEKDVALTRGKQAITYVKCFEAQTGMKVNEVWFVENKHSRNRDESPQMRCYKITLDKDTRRLYEAMLYEPLRRMVEAVGDPDYVFTINDSDTLSDKAELYDFWIKTMTAEVDDFAIPYDKRTLIAKRQKKIRDASMVAVSPRVISEFRRCAQSFITYDLSQSNMENKEKIEHVLRTFGIIVKVSHEIEGYSSTTYLLEASAGVKIANVARYKLDIAGALNVASVRICDNLMVYDGRSYLCVEVQHKRTKDLYFDPSYLDAEKIPIGVDNFGRTVVWDMNNQSTPHVLICGATGSGKSVSIISTLNYAKLAGVRDIIIFDPKCEFGRFAGEGVRIFNDIADIEYQMKMLVEQMQKRAKTGVNSKTLVIFDEFADAVQSARSGAALDVKQEEMVGVYANGAPKMKIVTVGREKSLEENLRMLLQKGRSLGYRVIAATQRASTKVITGDAKVNFPVQICFRVPKEVDSKVVLDEAGAETLAGLGDGLMRSPEYPDIVRFQGFYCK